MYRFSREYNINEKSILIALAFVGLELLRTSWDWPLEFRKTQNKKLPNTTALPVYFKPDLEKPLQFLS